MNEANPNNPLTSPAVQEILAKAAAYKKGAMVGAGLGLLVSLFLVKGRYVLCTLGGGLIGGYFNYKMAETKQAPPTFTNYGTAEPMQQKIENTDPLQQNIINSADGIEK